MRTSVFFYNQLTALQYSMIKEINRFITYLGESIKMDNPDIQPESVNVDLELERVRTFAYKLLYSPAILTFAKGLLNLNIDVNSTTYECLQTLVNEKFDDLSKLIVFIQSGTVTEAPSELTDETTFVPNITLASQVENCLEKPYIIASNYFRRVGNLYIDFGLGNEHQYDLADYIKFLYKVTLLKNWTSLHKKISKKQKEMLFNALHDLNIEAEEFYAYAQVPEIKMVANHNYAIQLQRFKVPLVTGQTQPEDGHYHPVNFENANAKIQNHCWNQQGATAIQAYWTQHPSFKHNEKYHTWSHIIKDSPLLCLLFGTELIEKTPDLKLKSRLKRIWQASPNEKSNLKGDIAVIMGFGLLCILICNPFFFITFTIARVLFEPGRLLLSKPSNHYYEQNHSNRFLVIYAVLIAILSVSLSLGVFTHFMSLPHLVLHSVYCLFGLGLLFGVGLILAPLILLTLGSIRNLIQPRSTAELIELELNNPSPNERIFNHLLWQNVAEIQQGSRADSQNGNTLAAGAGAASATSSDPEATDARGPQTAAAATAAGTVFPSPLCSVKPNNTQQTLGLDPATDAAPSM